MSISRRDENCATRKKVPLPSVAIIDLIEQVVCRCRWRESLKESCHPRKSVVTLIRSGGQVAARVAM